MPIGVGLDQARIDGKSFTADQLFLDTTVQDVLEHAAEEIAFSEMTRSVLRERRVIWHRTVQAEPAKPAVSQIEMNLIAQTSLRSDTEAIADQEHPYHQLFAYSTNYLIDVENAIVVEVEATTAIRQAEVLAAKRMIERSLERFDLYPCRLLGDSGYGSAEMLAWLVYEHGIEPHVTVFDKSARTDGIFSRDDFTYDHTGDAYRCPGGKVLTTTGTLVNDGATMLYLASKHDVIGAH
ncbi:hypothetical protein ACVIGB_008368 [Bradyrhizobium sp. USDA 4341]